MSDFGVFYWTGSKWVFQWTISRNAVSGAVYACKRVFDSTGVWNTCVKLLSYADL